MGSDISGEITLDGTVARGYRRSDALQDAFEKAKANLLQGDPWTTKEGEPPPGPPELRCDLALEGGGVKGIGLVGAVLVLDEAGYKIQRVAGTSAGAIAAALIASIVKSGHPMTELKTQLDALEFGKFMAEGKLRRLIEHVGGRFGDVLEDTAALTEHMGLYSGDYLYEWLTPILQSMNVETFRDLEITEADDPGMSLPPERRYRLVVHTSDVTRRQLVRLPWDCDYYGLDPLQMKVSDSVRASMSIPFFFVPYECTTLEADVKTPVSGGQTIDQHYAPGTATWVDGGMLENFPIDAFDRVDGKQPRWPTIGIKLSSFQTEFGPTTKCKNAIEVAIDCLMTMMNEWNAYSVEEASAVRTIFVDNAKITATDFNLTRVQQDQLFKNGVVAATEFILEMGNYGSIPRNPDQAEQLVAWRKALTMKARGQI